MAEEEIARKNKTGFKFRSQTSKRTKLSFPLYRPVVEEMRKIEGNRESKKKAKFKKHTSNSRRAKATHTHTPEFLIDPGWMVRGGRDDEAEGAPKHRQHKAR